MTVVRILVGLVLLANVAIVLLGLIKAARSRRAVIEPAAGEIPRRPLFEIIRRETCEHCGLERFEYRHLGVVHFCRRRPRPDWGAHTRGDDTQ